MHMHWDSLPLICYGLQSSILSLWCLVLKTFRRPAVILTILVHVSQRESLTFIIAISWVSVQRLFLSQESHSLQGSCSSSTRIMDTSITPATKVMTLFLLITSILVVIARGTTKAFIVRSTNLDDYLIALSLVSKIHKPHRGSQSKHLAYTRL